MNCCYNYFILGEAMNVEWIEITEPANYNGAAVYKIRIVEKGAPAIINRFLGSDNRGIIVIGMSTKMENRRRQFVLGRTRGRGHSEGNLLCRIQKFAPFNQKFSRPVLQYKFFMVKSKEEADNMESRLIKAYVRKFGEVPPLNSAIPKRYDEDGWG